MRTKLVYVQVKFHREDENGEIRKIKASINPDGTWNQWGTDKELLGENVTAIEAVALALNEELDS